MSDGVDAASWRPNRLSLMQKAKIVGYIIGGVELYAVVTHAHVPNGTLSGPEAPTAAHTAHGSALIQSPGTFYSS